MNYLIGGFTDLCIGMKKALAIGIVSYFQSLLTLKTWWERKYEMISCRNHYLLLLYLHERMQKKSFTKANERLVNNFLCGTDTCTSIRWDYPEEGVGLQAAVVRKLKSRFICS